MPPGAAFAPAGRAVTYDRFMLRRQTRRVQALVVCDGWSAHAQRTVTASVHAQARAVDLSEDLADGRGDVLVVTAPVLLAPGAVAALRRSARSPDRVVTRVLLPGGEPTDVALWSGAWLHRHGVHLHRVPELGLEFDRVHLPRDDPQARAWVRADDVGISALGPEAAAGRRGSVLAGVRLWARRATASARGGLGQIRRARALARQRRRHFGR